jgi:hypothetical protein
MRNLLLLSACILFSFATFGQGVDNKTLDEAMPYKHVLKANPITMAFGNFNLTWERVINNKSTYTITGNINIPSFDDDVFYNIGFPMAAGIAVTVGYKYYFTHAREAVPEGFYVRPIAGISLDEYGIGARLGGQLGYQVIWDNGFVFDLGLGPQVILSEGELYGPWPSFSLGVGYAF